jgi:pimeloyl-ACP methyl ester carboxylesterase
VHLTVNGLRSPLSDIGPRTAEAVVFVHGNPGSHHDWDDLARHVSPFVRAVSLDMPGFGQADKPDHFDYTAPGLASHLGAAIDQLGIARAHLVLHDFGGPWGLIWAATHPDRVASVTLINIGIVPGYRWHYLARIWRTPIVGELFMAAARPALFRLLLRHGNPRRLPRPFVDRMARNFDRGTQRAVLRLYRSTSEFHTFSRLVAGSLGPLDLPVLVVWGRHDPYLPVRYAECQRNVFPRAQIVVLDDSGHWPYADDPDEVARILVGFLRAHVGER